MIKKIFYTIFIIFIIPKISNGQDDIIIDQVVAIVGNNEILLSDIENQYLQMLAQQVSYPGDIKCNILEELLIQKLLLNQAQVDSIEVSDVQVEIELNERLNYYISQIGSEEDLEQYFNRSIVEIKDDLRGDLKDQFVTQQMRSEIIGDIKITPSEVRNFYRNADKDSLPLIEGQIEYYQIVKYPPYSEDAVLEVRERLLKLRERILNGEKFSKLAALYSEDPSSAMGGEMGFKAKGELDPEYAKVSFSLQEGAVSKIVECADGYHIIQMIERRGERVNTRHILMKPKVDPEQAEKARLSLDSLSNLIRNDSIEFKKAAHLYSEDKDTKMNGGQVVNIVSGNALFEIKDLPQIDYIILKDMNLDEVSNPFESRDKNGKVIYKIVMLKTQIEPHRANLEYDFPLLAQIAKSKKQENILFSWVEEKQRSTYTRIKGSFKNCSFRLKGWVK